MKTSKLIGPALDWAVAKSEGINPTFNMKSHGRTWHGWWVANPIYRRMPHYSTDWSKGGPIIERERITIDPFDDFPNWCATIPGHQYRVYGPTLLIAAMRCYVASKLGDEVDIPKELLGEQ